MIFGNNEKDMIFSNKEKDKLFSKEKWVPGHYPETIGKALEIYDAMMSASTLPSRAVVYIEGKYPLYKAKFFSPESVNLKVLEKVNQKDLYLFLLEAHQYIENPKWQQSNRDSMKAIVIHFLHENGLRLYEELLNRLGKNNIPDWLWKYLYYGSWDVQALVFRDLPTETFDRFLAENYWNQVPILFLPQAIQRIQERDDYWGGLPAELIQELVFDKR